MARSRGSIAFLMNSLSSGSSSSSSVCGLGTLTSSISSSLARSRESRASSSFLMSVSCIPVSFTWLLCDFGTSLRLRHFCAAEDETLLHARPEDKRYADREDRRRQRPQHEHRVVVIGDLQRLVERPFGQLAQDQPDDEADERIAVAAREVAEQAEQDRHEHVHHA